MTEATQTNRTVLAWAILEPKKNGSFEKFMVAMSRALREVGYRFHVVFCNDVPAHMQNVFAEAKLSWSVEESYAMRQRATLLPYLQRLKPAMVHLHFVPAVNSLVTTIREFGIKAVVSCHHSLEANHPVGCDGALEYVKRLRRKHLTNRVNMFLPVSDFIADYIRTECGVESERVITVHNGIDLEVFSPVNENRKHELKDSILHCRRDEFVVTYVAQLSVNKGYPDFKTCTNRLQVALPNARFFTVGEPDADTCECPPPNLRHLGLRNDVQDILRASDIMVAPSRWQEAFGLSLAEASACGIPVIASRTGGIPEVIEHGRTGLLFNTGDVDDLCANIKQLAKNKEQCRHMGRAGSEKMRNQFSLQYMINKTINIYNRRLNIMEVNF